MKDSYLRQLRLFLGFGCGVSRQDIQDMFDIGPAQASRLLKEFISIHNNTVVRTTGKTNYHPTADYYLIPEVAVLMRAELFLDDLHGQFWVSERIGFGYQLEGRVDVFKPINRHADFKIIKTINLAFCRQHCLDIGYVKMTPGQEDQSISNRTIAPICYQFVYDRWHLHAYCFDRKDNRDFLLSRIVSATPSARKHAPASAIDKAHQVRTFVLVPHRLLSDRQGKVVEREFGMVNGCATVTIRESMSYYFMSRYLGTLLPEEKRIPPNVLVETKN